ncbi:MAG: GTP-binding protein [Candidatus Oleimicrobiaceae bacterium]
MPSLRMYAWLLPPLRTFRYRSWMSCGGLWWSVLERRAKDGASRFFSHTLQAEGHFSRQGWEGFAGSLGPGLMRPKGFISLEGDAVYVDATTARMTLSSTGRPGDGQNRLVIIGQGLQHQVIEAAFSRELTGTAP